MAEYFFFFSVGVLAGVIGMEFHLTKRRSR